MQQRRSIMTAGERNHRSTGRRACWYLRGHSMLSKMGTVQGVEHDLRPNGDNTKMSKKLEPPTNTAERTTGRFVV
jgi:hypothetical protein